MKFKTAGSQTHPMIRKQLDLPPAVARVFVKDMKAFFAEEDLIKRKPQRRSFESFIAGLSRRQKIKYRAWACHKS
jgi:hypothetical protein